MSLRIASLLPLTHFSRTRHGFIQRLGRVLVNYPRHAPYALWRDSIAHWLVVIGALVAFGSVSALIYARKQRLLVKSAALKVSGRSIDSLNVASLRRRLNRSLVIQEANYLAIIDGKDLAITWQCAGYSRADHATAIEFSIDADTNIPFDDLDCFAYDLRRDPRKQHPIRPMLIGPDGISKKIRVPFLAPLSAQEPFSMVLKCRMPGCMNGGVDYYAASLSFDQERIDRYSMCLIFWRDLPEWVRAYERRANGDLKLLKALRPIRKNEDRCEYLDVDSQIGARSARVYVFYRRALSARGELRVDDAAA
jgi:hypothetical protein